MDDGTLGRQVISQLASYAKILVDLEFSDSSNMSVLAEVPPTLRALTDGVGTSHPPFTTVQTLSRVDIRFRFSGVSYGGAIQQHHVFPLFNFVLGRDDASAPQQQQQMFFIGMDFDQFGDQLGNNDNMRRGFIGEVPYATFPHHDHSFCFCPLARYDAQNADDFFVYEDWPERRVPSITSIISGETGTQEDLEEAVRRRPFAYRIVEGWHNSHGLPSHLRLPERPLYNFYIRPVIGVRT